MTTTKGKGKQMTTKPISGVRAIKDYFGTPEHPEHYRYRLEGKAEKAGAVMVTGEHSAMSIIVTENAGGEELGTREASLKVEDAAINVMLRTMREAYGNEWDVSVAVVAFLLGVGAGRVETIEQFSTAGNVSNN